MNFQYQFYILICQIFLLEAVKSSSSRNIIAKPTIEINQNILNYLNLENSLWKYIDEFQTTEQYMKIKKIVINHRNFMNLYMKNNYNFNDKYSTLNRFHEWQILEKDFIDINGYFVYFQSFLINYSNDNIYNERGIYDFTDSILNNSQFQIQQIYKRIDNIMLKQTLYYRIMLEARDEICTNKQSAQQFLYSLYSDIALTELKGYTMVQFSLMMLRMYNKGNFTEESVLIRNDFTERMENTQKLLRRVLKTADRVVWECDPNEHVQGKTYEEVTRLLQGYIENEVDLNSDNTCRENCEYYSISKNHGCYKDLYCSRQPRCTGKLLSCQYVDSDMWICPSSLNSTRRYEYIEYESGRILGKKGKCSRGQSKVDSWWRWLFWHCSYCFCLCDEQGIKSDRYFNLRETVTDMKNNMVVTGLRFVKRKRIIHLQIQQGQLLPNGNIQLESLTWQPVDDYQIFDRNVKSKIDYHTMAWDSRAIDLDDINGDNPTHVVTGVRFRVVGTHLNLEARLSEYNFETGQLVDPLINTFWKSNDNTDVSGVKRSPILLNKPDIPIRSITKSIPTSKHNQYIEFTNSDMDKDVAQSTVPFIDIQPVISNPPVPLSGVGIYHKGTSQFGGFIAPKLITYDFEPYIHSQLQIDLKN